MNEIDEKKEIELSEEELLQVRLISSQINLVNVSLDNLELKKQLLLVDKKSVMDDFLNFKKEINESKKINYDDYVLNFESKKLVKKN